MQLTISQKTDIGLKRQNNQDNMMHLDCQQFKLFVVADGMGGASGGEIASKIAVSTIKSSFDGKVKNLFKSLKYSITQANRNIFLEANKNPETYKGMGTTVAALAIKKNKAYVAHVGDSRVYIYRNNSLKRLTKDHSKLQRMIDTGAIDQKDAQNHPEANIITRAIGIMPSVNIETPENPIDIQKDDIFLLCSDGLCGKVSDETITSVIDMNHHVDDICDQLMQKALETGGDDNITIQTIHVESIEPMPKKTIKNKEERKTIMNWIKNNILSIVLITLLVGIILFNNSPMMFFQSTQDKVRSILKTPVQVPKIDDVKKEADNMVDKIFGSDQSVDDIKKNNHLKKSLTDVEAPISYQQQDCDVLYTDIAQEIGYGLQNGLLAVTDFPTAKENKLGKQVAKEIEQIYFGKIDQNKEWTAYIKSLGQYLAKFVKRKGINYHFHVIQDASVNAFAIPGGGIYIFTGILDKIKNEAQLMAILAHEIKHVDLKHCISIYQITSALPGGMDNSLSFITTKIIKHLYSSRQEADADRRGLEMIYACGYSPYQSVRFWEEMKGKVQYDMPDVKNANIVQQVFWEVQNVVLTHPKFPKRVCLIKNHIQKLQKEHPRKTLYVGKWNYENRIPMQQQKM